MTSSSPLNGSSRRRRSHRFGKTARLGHRHRYGGAGEVFFEGAIQRLELAQGMRFDLKQVGPQIQGALDIFRADGGGENNNGEGRLRPGAKPFQDVKTVEARHFEVQEQQIRERKFAAISIMAIATEVGDGIGAAFDFGDDLEAAGLGESAADENPVDFGIVDQQDVKDSTGFSFHAIRSANERAGRGTAIARVTQVRPGNGQAQLEILAASFRRKNRCGTRPVG